MPLAQPCFIRRTDLAFALEKSNLSAKTFTPADGNTLVLNEF